MRILPARPSAALLAALVYAALVAATLSAPVAAYVGQWRSFTDKTHVTALVEHQGFVYAGTTGGIRRVNPSTLAQVDFDNLDGLMDPWIVSFVHDAQGSLWAVARDGYLYRLRGDRWDVTGRSYASLGWKMNERAALAGNSFFYLGSEKGLTIFDAVNKVSQLNVTRFRNELDVPVLSLRRLGDTLFVGTRRGVFKAGVYFADPLNPPTGLGYTNLADPSAWTRISTDTGYSLVASGDSVVAGRPGILIETPVRVEAFTGTPLVIGTQTYPAASTGFKTAAVTAGRVFVGGDTGLFVSRNPSGSAPDAENIPSLRAYPRDTVYNIGANAGRIWAHSPAGLHALNTSTGAFAVSALPAFPEPALTDRNLRNTRVTGTGEVYLGTWGFGLHRFQNGALVQQRSHGSDSCIFQANPNETWTVVHALSAPRGGGLYFSVSRTDFTGDHQLVYFDTSANAISCPTEGLSVAGNSPHAVHAFSDTLLGVASEAGLVLFKTRLGVTAPLLESKGKWVVEGAATETWDLATDAWGRPWAVTGSNLAFLDFDSLDVPSNRFLDAASNFGGTECKSLEADAAGTLWVGCANGLYNMSTGLGGGATLVKRYGMDDGLLSLVILDVAVDPVTGKVWVATDRGVSMLEGPGPPSIPDGKLATVLPYPNPFRPQHRFVIFKELPRNATLRIHNATGNVVRIFRPADLTGNEAQWDGKNEQGKAVSPGVYLFSVTSGSAVQRGKIIVAR